MKKKISFLERLTGAQHDDYDRILDEDHHFGDGDYEYDDEDTNDDDSYSADEDSGDEWDSEEEYEDNDDMPAQQEGELPVDMYQTGDSIVIRALVAGVSPNDLEISITRDMVTVRGLRQEAQEAHESNYHHRELFWGSFTRTIILPEEVIIDEADAQEKHGLLEIRLPKLDKNRSTQLRVKSHAQGKH